MTYSYEEIRSVALDLLAGRESPAYDLSQYQHFLISVGVVLAKREGKQIDSQNVYLNSEEKGTLLEVFWDFFRQGIITLGLNDNCREFPWFRITELGEKILQNQSGYFFHDVSSYEKIINSEIPSIDKITLLYLKESMQAFQSGCLLSSTVMLGVATEHTFNLLLENTQKSEQWKDIFAKVIEEKGALKKINKFRNILGNNMGSLPKDLKEDLDTQFSGIISIIRNFRNETGHPTGKIVSREQVFILLQLFISYCKKLYALMDFFLDSHKEATLSPSSQSPSPTESSSSPESASLDE
jgi:hypothetical protein